MKRENVILFDGKNNVNVMVKYSLEEGEAGPKMFMVAGKIAKAIYISKYQNTMINNVPCSVPYAKPVTGINMNEAEAACKRKGSGWHLMTNTEYKFLLDEMKAAGVEAHGNTDCGKYHKDNSENGERYDYGHTLTGSGPVTWNHDHTIEGVADLCGNVWEWVSGLAIRNGVVCYIENNDAAVVDTSKDSEVWKVAMAGDKEIKLSATKDGVTITTGEVEDNWNGCHMKEVVVEDEAAMEMIMELGILNDGWQQDTAGLFADSSLAEAVPFRGSSFFSTSNGGVGALGLNNPRTDGYNNIGFRSAYVEL